MPEDSLQASSGTGNVNPVFEDIPPPIPPIFKSGPTPPEKQWAVAIHLSALIGFVIPFFNVFAPLIIWLLKRPESTWLDAQGKQVLNFQISFTIYAFIAGLSVFVFIGFLLLPLVVVVYLALLVVGAIRASEGALYRFPMTMKFLS